MSHNPLVVKLQEFERLVNRLVEIECELRDMIERSEDAHEQKLRQKDEEIRNLQARSRAVEMENESLKQNDGHLRTEIDKLSHAIVKTASEHTQERPTHKASQPEPVLRASVSGPPATVDEKDKEPTTAVAREERASSWSDRQQQTRHLNQTNPRAGKRHMRSRTGQNIIPPPPSGVPPPLLQKSVTAPHAIAKHTRSATAEVSPFRPGFQLPEVAEYGASAPNTPGEGETISPSYSREGEATTPSDEPGARRGSRGGRPAPPTQRPPPIRAPHRPPVQANELTEKEFYKKYWIEAGKIGEGSFARVRRITRKSDRRVFALKMIKKRGKSAADIQALQKEISILQQLNHTNVVRLLDYCDTKRRIYMVVEFCDGGDVFQRILEKKTFSEYDAAFVVRQVAAGLAHCHDKHVVHRDLKPDNLMYMTKAPNSPIKIIDFGLAGECKESPCQTPCGTAHYAAPEILLNIPYGTPADLWSLGVITYTLLVGFPPFFDANNNQANLYHLIKKAEYSFPSPFWDEITDGAKDLVTLLLVKDPNTRLNAEQVLEHPWVSAGETPRSTFDPQYMHQMNHWQSTRQFTERQLGVENPNADLLARPMDLYAPPSPTEA